MTFCGLDLPRKLVADHLHADLLAHLKPQVAHKVLIDPWLQFTHPSLLSVLFHGQRIIYLTRVSSSGRLLERLVRRCPRHQACIALEFALGRLAGLPWFRLAEVGPASEAVHRPAHLGFGTADWSSPGKTF